MRITRCHALLFAGLSLAGAALGGSPDFDTAVRTILVENCSACHNDKSGAGGVSVTPFLDPSSLTSRREAWERILNKVRSGQMPPRNVPRPSAEKIDAFVSYIQGEFDRSDAVPVQR